MRSQAMQSFTLQNQRGMRVSVLNYGAILTEIRVPDRRGQLANVVLNYSEETAYLAEPYYIGAVVGRYANRIDQGRLPIGSEVFQLSLNEPGLKNHLHGGFEGFHTKIWAVLERTAGRQPSLCLTYTSPHGEEGFPGTLAVTIRYRLTEQNELIVEYSAQTDRPTVVNLTNHSYFNLSSGEHDIRQHTLLVAASRYTPLNERYLPAESVQPVTGTRFDIREATELGKLVDGNPTFNYCLDKPGELTQAATLHDPVSGRRLRLYTTAPGLQVYSGEFLGLPFYPFAGVCLEPQHYPDTPNHPDFPTAILEASSPYQQTTIYKFDIE